MEKITSALCLLVLVPSLVADTTTSADVSSTMSMLMNTSSVGDVNTSSSVTSEAPSTFTQSDSGGQSSSSTTGAMVPSISSTVAGTMENTTESNSTDMPDISAPCLQCENCTETNNTCISPFGICYMTFNTITNATDRGCEMNKTACDISYPGGISANDVCQYCCSGSLCNGNILTYDECKNIQGDGAGKLRVSAYVTSAVMVFGFLTRHLLS